MALSFSRALAVFVGVTTLLSEVVRRRAHLLDPDVVLLWIDDVLLAGFLLYGAWRVSSSGTEGRPILAAAWGVTCGMAYYSLFEQFHRLAAPASSGVAPVWVISVKGVLLAVGIAGMVTALRAPGASRRAGTL